MPILAGNAGASADNWNFGDGSYWQQNGITSRQGPEIRPVSVAPADFNQTIVGSFDFLQYSF
jgi:hypothetical protein